MGTKEFNFIDTIIAKLRLRKVLKYVKKGDTVLDFGCGYHAHFLRKISPLIKNGVGVDYDVDEVAIVPHIELKKLQFRSKLPFPDATFDKVFMLAVIEHFTPDVGKRLMNEIARILKNGGSLILTTPTPSSKKTLEFLAYSLKIISQKEIADHKKYYSRDDFMSTSENTQLKLVRYDTFQWGINSLVILKRE